MVPGFASCANAAGSSRPAAAKERMYFVYFMRSSDRIIASLMTLAFYSRLNTGTKT
jgi:hypothetical protein